jgi:hypothetical protein
MITSFYRKSFAVSKFALLGGLLIGAAALTVAQQPNVAGVVAPRDSRAIEAQVEALLQQLTLKEKIDYINSAPPENPNLPNSTGQNIRSVPRLGLPELRDADGGVGIALTETEPSTRYPATLCCWPLPGTRSFPRT